MYAVKNKYYKHSKLDEQCFRRILELFAMDLTAVQCANLTGVNVRSVNTIFLKLRDRISHWCELSAAATAGIDAGSFPEAPSEDSPTGDSYLESASDGVVGVRIFLNKDQVYCTLLNANVARVSANDHNMAGEFVDPRAWVEYPIGIDLRRDMRLKLKSATFQKACSAGDIDRIEAFARYLRLRLGKFKGLRREKFYYHLKESEYRFNHRRHDLYILLIGMLGETPIE